MNKEQYDKLTRTIVHISEGIVEEAEQGSLDTYAVINRMLLIAPKSTSPINYEGKLNYALGSILLELSNARDLFPTDYNSLHEAYGVIAEEIHELFTEIIQKEPNLQKVRKEATQAIVVLLRLIVELTPDEGMYGNATNS